ncbi:MAG: ElyC/SanA/YdcF family protein [Saprospiraceae bacterium]
MTILFALLTITNPLPEYLVRKLERKYPAYNNTFTKVKKQYAHVLVLGGGFTNDTSLPPNSRLASNSLTRVVEGIRVHRLLPNSKLIFSGKAKKGEISIAETMRATALSLGVDSTDILMMTEPSTTAKEADYYLENHHNDSTQLIIATSALHMPRAMLTFEKRGIEAIPAPTNHTGKGRLARSSEGWWGFSSGNMRKIEKALREMLAIRYEKMTD